MEHREQQKRDPDAYELIALGGWISRMAESLESDSQWQDMKRCLDYLAELEALRGLEFLGVEAKRHRIEIGKEYHAGETRLREKHRRQLQVALSLWEARLLETSKRWVLCVRGSPTASCKATDDVRKSTDGP